MNVVVDTNVLVRFLVRDDPQQASAAEQLLRQRPTLVLDTIILELEWVLRKAYRYDRSEVASVFDVMLTSTGIEVESPDRLAQALPAYRAGLDFADAFHLAGAAAANAFATFDQDFAKRAPRHIAKPPVLLVSDPH